MKLHIGGRQAKPGWKLLNIQDGPDIDYVGDIGDLSAFADSSLDQVYASHVLEHVPQLQVQDTFKGLHRVIKPGGRLMIAVPDLDVLCRMMLDADAPIEAKYYTMRVMFGGQVDANDYHYFGWTYDFLRSFLGLAGFSSLARVKSFGLFSDMSNLKPYGIAISLNVVAIK